MLSHITEKERLRKHQKIVDRVQDINRAGRVIVHDFSNLLLGLQGITQQLIKSLALTGSDEGKEQAKMLETGISRGKEMLQQLSSGHIFAKPNLKLVRIEQMITEATRMIITHAQSKNIEIHQHPGPTLLVNVDETQMIRVFTNL